MKENAEGLCCLWVRTSSKEFLKKIRDKYQTGSYSKAIDKLEEIYKKQA